MRGIIAQGPRARTSRRGNPPSAPCRSSRLSPPLRLIAHDPITHHSLRVRSILEYIYRPELLDRSQSTAIDHGIHYRQQHRRNNSTTHRTLEDFRSHDMSATVSILIVILVSVGAANFSKANPARSDCLPRAIFETQTTCQRVPSCCTAPRKRTTKNFDAVRCFPIIL